ncbi:MAG: hypothetical protein LBI42_05290 [Chitinispirillales bacterium]|nr:hypothetical protein [Chitinispirillales bacterium]
MYNITFISTVHKENGKCNSDELHKIIELISPDVIFLEALKDTCSNYERMLFSRFGVFHKKLEISAIQKYSQSHSFEYVPVLDTGLSDEFDTKIKIVTELSEYQRLIDKHNLLTIEYGFPFLNSEKSTQLHREMRELEKQIFADNEAFQKANASIDAYENSMLHNIYAYSKENMFNKAIFMCGSAHRESIIDKIGKFDTEEDLKLSWKFFNEI